MLTSEKRSETDNENMKIWKCAFQSRHKKCVSGKSWMVLTDERLWGDKVLEPFHISLSFVVFRNVLSILSENSVRQQSELLKFMFRLSGREKRKIIFRFYVFKGVNLYVFSALFRFKPLLSELFCFSLFILLFFSSFVFALRVCSWTNINIYKSNSTNALIFGEGIIRPFLTRNLSETDYSKRDYSSVAAVWTS